MGYGSHALKLLSDYYEGRIPSLSESEMEVGIEKELESTEVSCVKSEQDNTCLKERLSGSGTASIHHLNMMSFCDLLVV